MKQNYNHPHPIPPPPPPPPPATIAFWDITYIVNRLNMFIFEKGFIWVQNIRPGILALDVS